MLDMLIQGGRVVTPAGAGDWDVGVIGEKIVSVAFPGVLPAEAKQVIDARGKIVVPGGIETHAHAVANVQPGARTLVAGGFPTLGRWNIPCGPSGAARRQ
jgi:dihydroorotase-like cyclic amidohydrolase